MYINQLNTLIHWTLNQIKKSKKSEECFLFVYVLFVIIKSKYSFKLNNFIVLLFKIDLFSLFTNASLLNTNQSVCLFTIMLVCLFTIIIVCVQLCWCFQLCLFVCNYACSLLTLCCLFAIMLFVYIYVSCLFAIMRFVGKLYLLFYKYDVCLKFCNFFTIMFSCLQIRCLFTIMIICLLCPPVYLSTLLIFRIFSSIYHIPNLVKNKQKMFPENCFFYTQYSFWFLDF